jgi:hypothetical protein
MITHPMCRVCGWAQGGIDSWNGRSCKCGHSAAPFNFDQLEADEWRPHLEHGIAIALDRLRAGKAEGPSC